MSWISVWFAYAKDVDDLSAKELYERYKNQGLTLEQARDFKKLHDEMKKAWRD